jgi:hypothetical protein
VVIVALLSPDVLQQKKARVPKRTEEVKGGGKVVESNAKMCVNAPALRDGDIGESLLLDSGV